MSTFLFPTWWITIIQIQQIKKLSLYFNHVLKNLFLNPSTRLHFMQISRPPEAGVWGFQTATWFLMFMLLVQPYLSGVHRLGSTEGWPASLSLILASVEEKKKKKVSSCNLSFLKLLSNSKQRLELFTRWCHHPPSVGWPGWFVPTSSQSDPKETSGLDGCMCDGRGQI